MCFNIIHVYLGHSFLSANINFLVPSSELISYRGSNNKLIEHDAYIVIYSTYFFLPLKLSSYTPIHIVVINLTLVNIVTINVDDYSSITSCVRLP